MSQITKHKILIKLILLYFCLIKIHCKTLEYNIKKTTKVSVKKHHPITITNEALKLSNPELSLENRRKFIEKEYDSFVLKSKTANINGNKENINGVDEKQSINNNDDNNVINREQKEKNDINDEINSSNNDKSYYLYGGGIVSIALVGVGFFNVYQRNKNSLFHLTKEELEELDKTSKINNSYTSLSEEEKRFLHKINTRKHNNMKRYNELTEEEILNIRKKNGWADSDDGECQLRRRKIDKRLSSNFKINSTNVISPRRSSLNVKLDKDSLISKYSYRKSCNDIENVRKTNILDNNNFSSKNINKSSNRKRLSINTKNISMPPIKMICTIIKNYKPIRSDEIELKLGDKVEIMNVYKDGWATGKVISNNESDEQSNTVGYFPLAHASEPEIFDDNINNVVIPSPLTPPISRSSSNMSYQNSPLFISSSFPKVVTNYTTAKTVNNKSKNRHISMVAVSSSSTLTEEPHSVSTPNTTPSVININNNINIIQQNINSDASNININININPDVNESIINNISINNNDKENKNTPLIKTSSTVFYSAPTTPSSLEMNRRDLLDKKSISNILNEILEEEHYENKICHSQEVFDFLRENVYNSKVPMEEREYYRKCLERLRMSKILDMEFSKN